MKNSQSGGGLATSYKDLQAKLASSSVTEKGAGRSRLNSRNDSVSSNSGGEGTSEPTAARRTLSRKAKNAAAAAGGSAPDDADAAEAGAVDADAAEAEAEEVEA